MDEETYKLFVDLKLIDPEPAFDTARSIDQETILEKLLERKEEKSATVLLQHMMA